MILQEIDYATSAPLFSERTRRIIAGFNIEISTMDLNVQSYAVQLSMGLAESLVS